VERGEGKMKLGKLNCIAVIPFLPLLLLIDILFGDYVTGIKTSIIEKIRQNRTVFMQMWRNEF
jgi:hypothetical protein